MKVNRWDVYIMGRYVFHVYYTEDVTDENDSISEDLVAKGILNKDTDFQVYKRDVEKDK